MVKKCRKFKLTRFGFECLSTRICYKPCCFYDYYTKVLHTSSGIMVVSNDLFADMFKKYSEPF